MHPQKSIITESVEKSWHNMGANVFAVGYQNYHSLRLTILEEVGISIVKNSVFLGSDLIIGFGGINTPRDFASFATTAIRQLVGIAPVHTTS